VCSLVFTGLKGGRREKPQTSPALYTCKQDTYTITLVTPPIHYTTHNRQVQVPPGNQFSQAGALMYGFVNIVYGMAEDCNLLVLCMLSGNSG